jgi:hypothetical protein
MVAFVEIVNTYIFQSESDRERPVVTGKLWQGDISKFIIVW